MTFFSRRIADIFPRRIWQQILAILICLVVIPLITLGTLLIGTSQDAIKTSILHDRKEIVGLAATEVSEFIKGPQESLMITAAILGTLGADSWRQETAIVELALRYPIFRKITSIGKNGQELATSTLGVSLGNRTGEEGFLKAMSGDVYMSEVYVSDDHVPMVIWAVPIWRAGKVTGVLMAEISLRGVWDIVDSIKIGKTGKAHLIDKQGRLLSHSDKKLILQNKSLVYQEFTPDSTVRDAISWEETDEQGTGWLAAYAPIKVKGLDWGLLIFQSQEEAYSFIQVMKFESWSLIIVSILAAIFISIGISRLMSKPTTRLIERTKRIANGDFDPPLLVNRKDEMGQLIHAFNDMTEKIKSARRMEKLSTIGQAATAIAHELKNSLMLVNTYVQLLPERHKDKKFTEELSEIVPRELDSWKKMLQEMMDYSKVDQLSRVPMRIGALLEDISASLQENAKQNNIQLLVESEHNLPLVNGNQRKLRQALVNLLSNAFERTPAGGAVSVYAECKIIPDENHASFVAIHIKDSGQGIPKADLTKIFEPFYTTKSNGLGLGLAICKEIIGHHKGWIEVSSEVGQGSTFSVYVPALLSAQLSPS